MPNLTHCRDDFPILKRPVQNGMPLAFLDNAASTQRPQSVINRISECYEKYYANVHRGIHTLSEESTERYERSRKSVAKFIGAKHDHEVIYTAGATAAINTVARSWGRQHLSSGDTILLTIAEHHANIVPWQQLAAEIGFKIEFLPLQDDFQIQTEAVQEALARYQPKLFAFTAASNVLGTSSPVTEWTALAHQQGSTVLVDAAQSAPHQPLNVQAWNADFLVFSGHKVCGPTGIGVLHGKEHLLDEMPPFLGGGGMISRVTTEGFETAALPDKFEAGTPPIAEAIGLEAAVEYLGEVGLKNIEEHEKTLASHAEHGLRQIEGVRVIGPQSGEKTGIVSFVLSHAHAHDVAHSLSERGIAVRAGHHCTMPLHHALGLTATTRASFYLYNTMEEAELLVQSVAEIQKKFAPTGRRRRRQRK
ncbi:MAG: SufS family cysteine desulfurase [Planctomycetaceae bacterium]|nr:SufS family cysteine desulfurase [Planctomycetaceae bacterium]